ncbi:MAG: leucine-rich repeat domain-containing protein [Bacteroidaceae bacterium]|nr:leucine-rich repeat domain-containing protein [Bacteroidaceae bacterium]
MKRNLFLTALASLIALGGQAQTTRLYPMEIACTDSLYYEVPTNSYGEETMNYSVGHWDNGAGDNIPYLKVTPKVSSSQTEVDFVFWNLTPKAYYNAYLVTVPASEQHLPAWFQLRFRIYDEDANRFTTTQWSNPNPVTADSGIENADVILAQPNNECCYVSSGERMDTILLQKAFPAESHVVKLAVLSYGPSSMTYREKIYTRQLSLCKLILVPYATAAEAEAHVGDIPDEFPEPESFGGLYYEFYEDGTCQVVRGPRQPIGDVAIPETVTYEGKAYDVTSVGSYALWKSDQMTSLAIPASVKRVASYAFGECPQLRSLVVTSNENLSYGDGAFSGTKNVEGLMLDMEVIPEKPYSDFNQLKTITMSGRVHKICDNAFRDCSSLANFSLPESLDTIGHFAFQKSCVDSISFGENVKYIGEGVFADNKWLKAVRVAQAKPLSLENRAHDDYYTKVSPFSAVLYGGNMSNDVRLHVPAGSGLYYRVAHVWRDFPKIIDPANPDYEEEKLTYPTARMAHQWDTRYYRDSDYLSYKVCKMEDKDLIDNKIYTMLFVRDRSITSNYSVLKGTINETPVDTLYYRQEGDKVYLYSPQQGRDVLLFDYGLKTGDVFTDLTGERYVVTATDCFDDFRENVCNYQEEVTPKALRLHSEDGTKEDIWVEGAGSLCWGILPMSVTEGLRNFPERPNRVAVCHTYQHRGEDIMFDIDDEDYKMTHIKPSETTYSTPKPWTYTFLGDTLYISGSYNNSDETSPTCAEIRITEDNLIAMKIEQMHPHIIYASGDVYSDFELKYPNFKKGLYQIWNDRNTIDTLYCEGPKAPDGYRPFVENYRQWHVLGFCEGPYSSEDDYLFGPATTEVEIDGKTYMPMYKNDLSRLYSGSYDKEKLCGLFREEERRVYVYDEQTQQEHLAYDFTLEVGDTFDIGWGIYADRCVVTRKGEVVVKGNRLHTITFSSVDAAHGGNGLHQGHTWIEGIGDWQGPMEGWVSNTAPSSWSYSVAYMARLDWEDGDISGFYPFDIWGVWGGGHFVFGQELVKGDKVSEEDYLANYYGHDELNYEIVDKRLHVWGGMWIQCGPNNYVYCKISPYKDDNATYQISVEKEEVEPTTDCGDFCTIDLYFDLHFLAEYTNYKFIAIDYSGEHEVPWRSSSDYRPFVEEGKVWKVGNMNVDNQQAKDLRYYYFDGDTTLLNGQHAHKLMRRTETAEARTAEYVAALYENDRIVFCEYPEIGYEAPLYDFAAETGDTTWICSPYFYRNWQILGCTIAGKSYQKKDAYEGVVTKLDVFEYLDLDVKAEMGTPSYATASYPSEYIEGVGSSIAPLKSLERMLEENDYEHLMSCIVGTDTLYNDVSLTEDISQYWDEDVASEVKKQKLDFTHVVKTRPTAYRVPAAADGGDRVEGEFDDLMASLGVNGLSGQYRATITNATGEVAFSQTLGTDNLLTLDIRLSEYPEGDYTLTLENDDEAFVAHFRLPFDGNGISPVRGSATDLPIYDLTGRRLTQHPQRGLYIRGRQKLIVRP